jgi:hypothetical protein
MIRRQQHEALGRRPLRSADQPGGDQVGGDAVMRQHQPGDGCAAELDRPGRGDRIEHRLRVDELRRKRHRCNGWIGRIGRRGVNRAGQPERAGSQPF